MNTRGTRKRSDTGGGRKRKEEEIWGAGEQLIRMGSP